MYEYITINSVHNINFRLDFIKNFLRIKKIIKKSYVIIHIIIQANPDLQSG